MSNKAKEISWKNIIWIATIIILAIVFLIFMFDNIIKSHSVNKNIFSYSVKVRDSIEEIDKIVERAEINVNAMANSIASNYDTNKQNDKNYNLSYIKQTDNLVQSILQNSPGADGTWFQLNSNLPFSSSAYNWYEFKDNQFINLRDEFESDSSTASRKITPEDDPYYFGALGKLDATWSDLYTDTDTKNQMVTLSQPVYKNGILVGVVGIDISANNLEQALQKIQFILSGPEIYLINNKNKVIITLGINNKPLEIEEDLHSKISKINEDGLLEYNGKHGNKTVIVLTLSNEYKTILAFDSKIIYGNVNQLITAIYILLILFIISFVINIMPIKNEQIESKQEDEDQSS